MTNNLIKDNIQLDSTKLTRDGADGYSSALFELHLQLHSQVANPYTFNPKQNYNSYSTLKESYNYDGTYGPIPDENGFVDLTDYASLYISNYSTVTSIPEENQKYLDSGILPINMTRAFYGLDSVSSINLEKLNTEYVSSLESCFEDEDTGKNDNLKALTEVIGINNWNTNNLTNFENMFTNCVKLVSLDLTKWNIQKITDLYRSINTGFIGCSALVLNLSGWDCSSITSFEKLFYNTDIKELNVKNWIISPNVTNFSNCFGSNSSTIINVSGWNISNAVNISNMFYSSKGFSSDPPILSIIGFEDFDTSNVENMSEVFEYTGIKNINLTKWNVSKVKNMSGMFRDCSLLNSININTWNTANVTDMSHMFSGTMINDLSLGLDTSNLTTIEGMFYASNINNLDLTNFDTSNITNMDSTFYKLTSNILDISNLNVSKLEIASYMFDNININTIIYPKSFYAPNLKKIDYMFANLSNKYLDFVKNILSQLNICTLEYTYAAFDNMSLDDQMINYIYNLSFKNNTRIDILYGVTASSINFNNFKNIDKSKILDIHCTGINANDVSLRNLKVEGFEFDYANINNLDLTNADTSQNTSSISLSFSNCVIPNIINGVANLIGVYNYYENLPGYTGEPLVLNASFNQATMGNPIHIKNIKQFTIDRSLSLYDDLEGICYIIDNII